MLLWLVYPKDYSYGAAASTGLMFYPGQVRTLQELPWSTLWFLACAAAPSPVAHLGKRPVLLLIYCSCMLLPEMYLACMGWLESCDGGRS